MKETMNLQMEELEAVEAPMDWESFAYGVGAGLLIGAIIVAT